MLRKDLQNFVVYAVVTTHNYRPGERPHRGDVRPAWLLDSASSWGLSRYAAREPATIAYLRNDADLPVARFTDRSTLDAIWPIITPTLLAHHSDDARRRDFERLDAARAERAEAARLTHPNLAAGMLRGRTLMEQYEAAKAVVDACVFTRRPLYAILSTWDRYLQAQVDEASWELLVADSTHDDGEVEPDSLRAIRLFAEHGVAIDPSRTFGSEIVLTYDELFAAFGSGPASESGWTEDAP